MVIVLAHNQFGDSIVIGLIAVRHVRGLVCLFCQTDCKFVSYTVGERLPFVIATVQARLLVAYLSGNGCHL